MFNYHCLNPISASGLDQFTTNYKQTDDVSTADAILVRSAKMHDMELPEKLVAIARRRQCKRRKGDGICRNAPCQP